MPKEVVLNVTPRVEMGKQVAKRLRRRGLIPAVLYGPGEPPLPLEVDRKQFEAILHAGGRNVIVDLSVQDGANGGIKTIIREIQHHPVYGDILHVDFQHISLSQRVVVEVSVVAVGVAQGVKENGGILEHHLHVLEIECLPTEIPEKIEVDVRGLNIGDVIHVRDLLSVEPRIVTEPDRSVLMVVPPVVAKVVEGVEGEEEAPAEPELIRRERKPEDEAV
ncbi:MAG: 50S ribosomal protein L25 [Candidatus Latescibacteria bacterium]|nr:50S ribosomal protein L25 [Candidatus Latescibacterota bacterium]